MFRALLPIALWYGLSYLCARSLIVDFVIYAAGCVLSVVEVAVLSLSFQYLTGHHSDEPDSLMRNAG